MNVWKLSQLGCLSALALASAANAQPRITNLGTGAGPAGVSNTSRVLESSPCGTKTVDIGTGVTISTIAAPAAVGGQNALSADGQSAFGSVLYVAANVPGITGIGTTGNTIPGSWSQGANAWIPFPGLPNVPAYNLKGTATSGSNNAALAQTWGMSSDGRYQCVQSYAFAITTVMTTPVPPAVPQVSWASTGSTFVYQAALWDTQTNTVKHLPTPAHQSGLANRWKDGRPLCVSLDGSVVMGGYNANVAGGAAGGAFIVWYKQADGEYLAEPAGQLPIGTDDGSRVVDNYYMTSDGLTIVGSSFDRTDVNNVPIPVDPVTPSLSIHTFVTKWTRPDAASRTWTRTKIYDVSANSRAPLSPTPGTISSWWAPYTDCNVAHIPPDFDMFVGGVSDDGNTIIGTLRYSTCGSFVSGGFIWKAGTGPGTGMFDLYDYLVAQGTIDIENFGMVGTLANHSGTILATPRAISRDGRNIVGSGLLQPGWVVQLDGSTAKAPFTVCDPASVANFSRCSTPALQFSHVAGGSGVLSSQWYKGAPGSGSALSNGTQPSPASSGIGSDVTNASTSTLRINFPNLTDVGSYYCTVSSSAGGSVDSAPATATPAFASAIANDLCAAAQDILLGNGTTNVLSYEACAAYLDEFRTGSTTCFAGTSTSDAWFKYTPASSGEVRIENSSSTYFSSVITVYDNCPGSGGFEIACSTTTGNTIALPSTTAKVRINRLAVTEGQPIWIRVATQGAPSAGFSSGSVRIYPAPAIPTNDACAAAFVANVGANAFDSSEASFNAGDMIGGTGPTGTGCTPLQTAVLSRDVWFVFTPTARGTLTASTCRNAADINAPLTTPDTVLSAYTACGGTEITGACNNNTTRGGCGTLVSVAPQTQTTAINTSIINCGQVQAGQPTYIRVGGSNATSTAAIGPGTLTISFVVTPCNKADVAGLGGSAGADGQVTVDDIVFYLAAFFANTVSVADLVSLGGNPTPDAQVTVDDLVYFLAQFFSPCNP